MTTKINPVILQVLNVIAVISVIIINILANVLPINGVNTGQVSDLYFNYFTPAGYVFSIWFIIYIQSIIFIIYQVRSSQREETYLTKINIFYFLGALANIAWIFFFHYSANPQFPPYFYLSVVLLLILLLLMLLVFLRLGIGKDAVPRNEKLAIHLHISVYLAWLGVASIAAIASALNVLIPGLPDTTQWLATAIMAVVAMLLAVLMVYLRRDFGFALVVLWASVGIAVKWLFIPIIAYTAITTSVIIVIALIVVPLIKRDGIVEYYLGPKKT
jgi:benzodiazapine receptor